MPKFISSDKVDILIENSKYFDYTNEALDFLRAELKKLPKHNF